MNREELIEKLTVLGIPPGGYSLDGSLKDNSYVLTKQDCGWKVFYYERGEMLSPRFFVNMESAYEYIYI